MKKTIAQAALAATLALVAACDDDGARPVDDAIVGMVVDAAGDPVAGATVILDHAPPVFTPDKPATLVQFVVATAGPVRCWVADDCRDEVLQVLLDGELPAGQYSIVWDGRDAEGRLLASGAYTAHLESADGSDARPIWFFREDPVDQPDPAAYRGHAVTDARGRFSIGQECLAFGTAFDVVDETGAPAGRAVVGRQVRLFALQVGHDVGATDWFTVDAEAGATARIVLPD